MPPTAAVLSERVFGPEADRLRAGAESRQPDPLATAFEQAVDVGRVRARRRRDPRVRRRDAALLGHEATARADRPTSPHILARHGRLGGVRVPSMTVRANGRIADRQLAALVAARMHDAIGEAYVGGRREFERLGGPPLRRRRAAAGRRPVTSRPGAGSGP